MSFDNIIRESKLFWQYPVITEKVFYEQNKNDEHFMGIPWATVIDKEIKQDILYDTLKKKIEKKNYYTCCQHVCFRKLIKLFKSLNINTVYASHKIKGEDDIDGVNILPCPLYAVNFEDKSRNEIFKDKDYINIKRNTLYSFVGTYNSNFYCSNIKKE